MEPPLWGQRRAPEVRCEFFVSAYPVTNQTVSLETLPQAETKEFAAGRVGVLRTRALGGWPPPSRVASASWSAAPGRQSSRGGRIYPTRRNGPPGIVPR